IGYAEILKFATLVRLHLRSAQEIATVLFPGQGPSAESVDALLQRLEFGLPEEALALLELPVRLTRGQYLSLHRSGVSAPEQVWSVSDAGLTALIGDDAGRRIAAMRPSATEAA